MNLILNSSCHAVNHDLLVVITTIPAEKKKEENVFVPKLNSKCYVWVSLFVLLKKDKNRYMHLSSLNEQDTLNYQNSYFLHETIFYTFKTDLNVSIKC